MNITLQQNVVLKWQLKIDTKYKWSECKKLINTNNNKVIKKVINGGSIGYWIGKKFITLNNLKSQIELIPKQNTPF